jgi:TolA-binding protein
MRHALVVLLALFVSVPAVGQEFKRAQKTKRELTKVAAKKAKQTERPCEFDSDCEENEVCDPVKRFCVRKAMSLVELETANLSQKVQEMQEKMSVLRQTQIKKMEELLATQPYYENKAEIYFRLGEAYWQENHYQYLSQRKVWMDAIEKFDEGVVKERPTEPSEDYTVALEYYRKVLREFPDYPRIDEVLYYLGRGALEAGRSNKDVQLQREGVKHFTNLVQNYPDSRLIPQALLHLGEYYFDTHSLYYAKVNYEKIITNYPAAPMFNYALYKLGWVYYNLTEFRKAIETFQAVIETIKAEGQAGKVEFREQALNDLVLSFVEVDDGWREAREYYTKEIGEEGAYTKLHVMGELYVAQGQDDYALQLYYHFIEKWPNTTRIPDYYQTIMDIANKRADWVVIEKVIREIMAYFKSETPWRIANKDNAEVTDAALKMVEELMFYIANRFHVEGDKLDKKGTKSESEPMYMKAAEYYAEYLKWFPDSPRIYEINFWYAEILYFNLGNYELAAQQYGSVIEKDKKGKFVEDAALGVIYCMEELMVKEGLRQRAKKGEVQVKKVSADDMRDEATEIKRTDLHKLEEQFIAAADKYTELLLEARKDPEFLKKYPDRGEMIPNIMYIAAETFYKHGMFGEAVLRFENIFKYDSKHRFAAIAATMIMDCYYRARNWDQVEEWARKLIREKNFLFKNKNELEMIIATSILLKAKDFETEGKTSASIVELNRLQKEFRNNKEIMAGVTYTLAYLYARAKDLPRAIEKYEELIRKYPKSPKAAEAQFVIAEIYEAQTQFRKAGEAFMAMKAFKDQEQTARAIINASTIFQSLGDLDATIDSLQAFLKLFPKHEAAPRAFIKIADLRKEKGDLSGAYKQYTAFTSDKRYKSETRMVLEANVKAGVVLYEQERDRNRAKAMRHFEVAANLFKRMDDKGKAKAREFAAEAAFYIAQYGYLDFSNFPIDTRNFFRMVGSLEKKAKIHQDVEALYHTCIATKSRFWATAAYYQVGVIYHEFAETLFALPLPEGLTEDEADMYKAELEDRFAAPLEEKARANFKQAILMAHKLGIYSEWSKKSARMAAKLTPQDFPIDRERMVKTNRTKDTLLSTSFIRSLRRGDVEVDFVTFKGEEKAEEEPKEGEGSPNPGEDADKVPAEAAN